MKIRNSFVTNSSSSSFLISNISEEYLSLKDLMDDWKDYILEEYESEITDYGNEYKRKFLKQYPTFEDFMEEVKKSTNMLYRKKLAPNDDLELECGDHECDDGWASVLIHNSSFMYASSHSDRFKVKMIESHH